MAILSNAPRGSTEEGEALLSPTEAYHPLPIPRKKPWLLLVGLIFVLVTIIDVGAYLAEAPQTRIFEANLCLTYYREHDPSVILGDGSIPEKLCKVDEVQQRLAGLFGWAEMFNAFPAILLAVPYGTLADRVGRKWVFMASLVGLQLNFAWVLLICEWAGESSTGRTANTWTGYFKALPLQLTWLSSAFLLIGGGPIVAMAVGLTMVSDVAPPEKRTTIFLYLTACTLLAEIVAPLMAARLMEQGEWLPLLVALAIQIAGVMVALFLPETLHLRDLPEPQDDEDAQSIELQPKGSDFSLKTQLRNFQSAVLFLRSDFTLALVVFTFLANRLGRQAMTLLVRYASKRYNWEIKQAAYLLSLRAATNLVAITVFIPLVNFLLLKKFRFPAHWADLYIARGSLVLAAIAFFVMGIAAHPSLLIVGLLTYNMGTGFAAAMRSVSIHIVGGQSSPDIGKLMSTIAIAESIGAMVAGPLLNTTFQWGIGLGTAWLGLPFLGSVVVLACMTAVTFFIDVSDKEVAYVEVQSNEEDILDEGVRSSGSTLEQEETVRHRDAS
jgi:MFS family permease